MLRFEPSLDRRDFFGPALVLALWLGITGVALWLTPSRTGFGTHLQLGLPPCPSLLVLHRPCMACGLTTSFTACARGDVVAAFHAHALGPALYLGLTLGAVVSGVCLVRRRRIDTSGPAFQRLVTAAIAVFVAYGIARFALVHYDVVPWYMAGK